MGSLWSSWEALWSLSKLDTLSLSFGVDCLVSLDTTKEFVTAVAVLDVLGTDVDTLGGDVVVHTTVDEDTNSMGGDVPDNTGSTTVNAVWHTTVDGTVNLDLDDIAKAESTEAKGWSWHTVLAVSASENVACTPTETF